MSHTILGLEQSKIVDPNKFVEFTCNRESRGTKRNGKIVIQREALSPDYMDWGYCQINIETAITLGYGTKDKSFGLLWSIEGSTAAAYQLYAVILFELYKRNLPADFYNLAFRYNCGPYSSPKWLKKNNPDKFIACNKYATEGEIEFIKFLKGK